MLPVLQAANLAVNAPTQASSGFSNQPAPNTGVTTLTWDYAWNAPASGDAPGALRRLHTPTAPAPGKNRHVPPVSAQLSTASSSRREGV